MAEFGENGWKQLPDAISKRYRFIPAKVEIDEHHVGVYASKTDDRIIKADHPKALLHGSLVSPTIAAAIMNGKYVNAVPLYRQEQEFQRMGVNIDRADMARWTILCAERYLSIFYDTYTKSYMNIMCFKPMKFRFLFQRNTEQPEQSTTCGFTEQE